jgi:hypothetical protein
MAAVFFAAAGLMISWGTASAGPIESTVRRNTPAGIWALVTYGQEDCGSYPVMDFKITAPPRHGTVALVKGPFTLGEKAGYCKGTRLSVPWVVYRPARDYVGPDSLSISWNRTAYTNDTHLTYESEDFTISVK